MTSLAHFQDREAAIAAFDRLWESSTPWILAFTGFSGHGKSTLLDWFEAKRCRKQNIPYALIGIGEHAAEIRGALHSLLESPNSNLHHFITVESLKTYRQERRSALEARNRRHLALTQRQEMHSSEKGEQMMSANVAEAYREMEAQADEVIIDVWLDCIETLQTQAQVILLLDNYDAYQDSASTDDLKRFWQVMERAYGRVPGLRVVIASREDIRHRNDLRVLFNGLADDSLQPLADTDSDALLQSLGVTEPSYRKTVFTHLAHGHPLVTRMAAEAWLEAAGGIPAKDVPHLTSRENAVEWVQGRILDRLTGPLKQAVRWAALLRWFHAESLESILGIDLGEDFRKLRRYAFIIRPRLAPQAWACHDLVRRVQMAYLQRERPQAFVEFHQKAHDYYNDQDAPLDALYHHFFLDQKKAFAAWQALENKAAFEFDHVTWSALMEIGLAPEIQLGPEFQAEVLLRAGRRHYYRAEWDLAEDHLTRALERFNAIGSVLGQANVLMAIGDVQQFRDDRDAALESYAQALERFNAIGSVLGQANVLKAIGDVQQFRKELDAALESYAQALERFNAIGSVLGQANVLKAIGDVQQFRKELDAALESYAQALERFNAIGSVLGQANVLKAIGDVQQFRDDRDAALESYAQALERFNAIGDRLGQANVLMAIGDVQQFRKELDAALESYAQALERFNAIGSVLGQANVLLSQGKLYLQQNEQDAIQTGAETLEKALILYQKIGGRVGQANVFIFLAQHLANRGQYAEALSLAQQALDLALQFAPGHPSTEWQAGFVQALEAAFKFVPASHDYGPVYAAFFATRQQLMEKILCQILAAHAPAAK